MPNLPCYVEFLTWNTNSRREGQGLAQVSKSMNIGGNLGHASMEISFPFTDETQEWINQYCKNIKLYEPSHPRAKVNDDLYTVDVPVYYTTITGLRIDDPLTYIAEHPDETLITHVYLSWVPGDFAAQRDERDPFAGAGKRSFSLYDNKQDRIMEHAGKPADFVRGYQGPQQIEYSSGGNIQDSSEYIVRENYERLHNLTPEEVRYFTLTPGQRVYIEQFDNVLDQLKIEIKEKHQDLSMTEYLIHYRDYVQKTIQDNQGKHPFEIYEILYAENEDIKEFYTLYIKMYLKFYNFEREDQLDATLKDIIKIEFIKTGLNNLLDGAIHHNEDFEIIRRQKKVNEFLPIVDEMEKNYKTMNDLITNIDAVTERITQICQNKETKKTELESLYMEYPLLKILYNRNDDLYKISEKRYFRKYLKKDIKSYQELREYLLNRRERILVGVDADTRVIVPIAKVGEHDGHPQGLDVKKMLEHIPKIISNGQGYAMRYKNCADFVQEMARAGAIEPIKAEFNRHALGVAGTPQVVANGAIHARLLLDNNGSAVVRKNSNYFKNLYKRKENKTAQAFNHYLKLEEKITAQDEIIQEILDNKSECTNEIPREILTNVCNDPVLVGKYLTNENLIKKTMREDYSKIYGMNPFQIKSKKINKDYLQNGKLFQLAYNKLLKQALYEHCDNVYHTNINQDKLKVYPDIIEKNGLFNLVSSYDPNPLSDIAIKKKMKELYPLVYQNKPILGKNRKLENDFAKRGELYFRACHTIIYENAPGTENLTDPNFQSMKQERNECKYQKRKLTGKMIGLVLLREFCDVFTNASNTQDPWYEIKFLTKQSKILLDVKYGKGSSFKKSMANSGRILMLGGIGVIHALSVAPRRLSVNFLSDISKRQTRKRIANASLNERLIDHRFALVSGKMTHEQLIKSQMRRLLHKKMSVWQRLRTSDRKMKTIIEKAYLNKDDLYQEAVKSVNITPEMKMAQLASQRNIQEHHDKENALFGENKQIVIIKKHNLSDAFSTYKDEYNKGQIPSFDKYLINKILHHSKKVDKILHNLDYHAVNIFSENIKDKLEQFKRISMISLGDEIEAVSDYFEYDPLKHGPIIPVEIQNCRVPKILREFFLARTEKFKDIIDDDDYHLLFTEKEINQMDDKTLIAAIRYLSYPSYTQILKDFEKMIVEKSLREPRFSVVDFTKDNIDDFKEFLKNEGLENDFIYKLEKKHVLYDLLVKLQYAECAAKSMQRLDKEYGHTDIPKTTDQVAKQRAKPFVMRKKISTVEPINENSLTEDTTLSKRNKLE